MKVLVTGGGGFLGQALCRALLERGDIVSSFQRSFHPQLEALGVRQVLGDLADAAAVSRACAGHEAVVHNAAKAGAWGSYQQYFDANVRGTDNVLAACRAHGIPRLVYTSTPSVTHSARMPVQGGNEVDTPYGQHFKAPYPAARSETPTILCAADHTQPRKRVGLLVAAFGLLRRDIPEARLVLSATPSGPSRWASVPGVEERVLDDRRALAAANREAWVHALPSVGEAFGLVLAEALACGTPVVGANAEVVGESATGARYPMQEESPAVLAEALRTTLAVAARPGTATACRTHAERFSAEATTSA
ncbi:MAG: NAD-dependent epimerase/dehydratase family protein, partial [Arenimonas sp.]